MMGSLNRISRVQEVDKLDIYLYKFEASKAELAQMGADMQENVCSKLPVEYSPYMFWVTAKTAIFRSLIRYIKCVKDQQMHSMMHF